jgi:hypothetical protein
MSAASVKEIHTVLPRYLTEVSIAADSHKEHRDIACVSLQGRRFAAFVHKSPHDEWDEFGGMILEMQKRFDVAISGLLQGSGETLASRCRGARYGCMGRV